MKSYYAPAERIEAHLLHDQIKSIECSNTMRTLFQSDSNLLLVINSNRQIVAFNRAVTTALGIAEPEKTLGLRLGEVLHCKYAFGEPNGCGTTPYCMSCGAIISMMAAIDDNQPCERKCALTTCKQGVTTDFCLLIRSHPIVIDRTRFVLIYAQDISAQQYWANLENEFLQDLDNKLTFVHNYSAFLHDKLPAHVVMNKLNLTLGRVVREVKLQQSLMNREQIQSIAIFEEVPLDSIHKLVYKTVLSKNIMTGRKIVEEGIGQNVTITTDPVLVSRVIIKMLLNAVEATEENGTVKLKTHVSDSQVTWQVWNKYYIPETIQLRIFQKYFSTKTEHGHGLGTYRMKLLGEKCLGGKVSFVSSVDDGTTFSFTLPIQ